MPGVIPSLEEFAGVGIGALMATGKNAVVGRRTGLPTLALYMTAGYFAGVAYTNLKLRKIHQREVFMWDYINQHPQDFPEVMAPQVLLKDQFETWHPMR